MAAVRRLVVDSADLPLNVSRETIQQARFSRPSRSGDESCPSELVKLAESDKDKFAKIWSISAPF